MSRLRAPRGFCLLVLLFVVPIIPVALAQQEHSRFEVGGQYSLIRLLDASGNAQSHSGFGGRLDVNLTRRLALESQLDFFPHRASPFLQQQGGYALQALFGIRGKVIQSKYFTVYGLLRPGLIHFEKVAVFSSTLPLSFTTSPATYFIVNLGGGIEFYPTPRVVTRFEISGNPYRIPNSTASAASGFVTRPGEITDHFGISVGVGYRLGALRENASEAPVSGKLEFGPQFTTLIVQRESGLDGVRTEPGVGGFASFQVWRFFCADSAVNFFLRDTNSSGTHDGGRIFQGLFGLKGGISGDHIGIFGKVRPGFNSYSRAFTGVSQISAGPPPLFKNLFDRSTNFVLDLGGVVELYPSRHTTLRFDLGDTHIYYATKSFLSSNGSVISVPGGQRLHSIELSVGYAWRFGGPPR
jgi:outer membrane protein with beta-barrel domain